MFLSHKCCFSCNENDSNENDDFTTCKCAMVCCAVFWCVLIGPRRSPFNFMSPSYQFQKPPHLFHSPPPIYFIAPPITFIGPPMNFLAPPQSIS